MWSMYTDLSMPAMKYAQSEPYLLHFHTTNRILIISILLHGRILQKKNTTMQVIEHNTTQKYTDGHKYFKPLVDGLTDTELNTNPTNKTLLHVVSE